MERLPLDPHSNRLEFINYSTLCDVVRLAKKLQKRYPLTKDRRWISAYFRKEILNGYIPDVSIRWIDETIGWGVFAEKDFEPMEFISEYSGLVRKRNKHDSKNSYCFEYLLAPGFDTPYIIDAREQGGFARYINHSNTPNLYSAFTLVDDFPHVVIYTAVKIAKGTQLCYDYGPDYWKRRKAPL